MLDGYWVSPKGEVLQVNSTHIQSVIQNPAKFGETLDRIKKDYERYKEQLTWEGKAREEIMIRIMNRGWARIRERSNQWTVQVSKINQKMNDVLWMWAKTIENKVRDKFMPVVIYEIDKMKSKPKSIDFSELSSGKSVSENVEYNTRDFRIVDNVDDLSDIIYPSEFDYTKLDESINKYLK